MLYHKDNLFEIYYELTQLFSQVKLGKIDSSYEEVFNGYLNKINNDVNINKNLAEKYFNELDGIITDKNKIVALLQNIPVNKALPPTLNCYYPTHAHCWKYTKFVDSIVSKFKTQIYNTKYKTFNANLIIPKNL